MGNFYPDIKQLLLELNINIHNLEELDNGHIYMLLNCLKDLKNAIDCSNYVKALFMLESASETLCKELLRRHNYTTEIDNQLEKINYLYKNECLTQNQLNLLQTIKQKEQIAAQQFQAVQWEVIGLYHAFLELVTHFLQQWSGTITYTVPNSVEHTQYHSNFNTVPSTTNCSTQTNVENVSPSLLKQDAIFNDAVDIFDLLHNDLTKLRDVQHISNDYKEEYIALENIVHDFKYDLTPDYTQQIQFMFDRTDILNEVFSSIMELHEDQLYSFSLNKNTAFRDSYLQRYTYGVRMLMYYRKLYFNDLASYENAAHDYTPFPDTQSYWNDNMYFLQMNRTVYTQLTRVHNKQIDISNMLQIMEQHIDQLNYWKDQNNQYNEEYIALKNIVNSLKFALEEKKVGFMDTNELKEVFNSIKESYEYNLSEFSIYKNTAFRESYLQRYVYSLRMLAYYRYFYLNEVSIIVKNRFTDTKLFWKDNLYFFSCH